MHGDIPARLTPLWHTLRQWTLALFDLIIPSICCYCGCELDSITDMASVAGAASIESTRGVPFFGGRARLCPDCQRRLTCRDRVACARCGVYRAPRVLSSATPDMPLPPCPHCTNRRWSFARVLPPLGPYAGDLRQAVVRMKRSHERPLVWSVGQLWCDQHGETLQRESVDLLVPIPRHWLRRWQTQQDVAWELADSIGGRLGIPVAEPLRWRRLPGKQSRLSRAQRARNLAHAMELRHARVLRQRSIAVVDDIMTTGATLQEAARALRQAGAARVVALVMARAAPDRSPTLADCPGPRLRSSAERGSTGSVSSDHDPP